MKKIRLNVANLDATEILSREQLKSILGGDGSTSSCGSSAILCNSGTACTTSIGTNGKCGIYELGSNLYCACYEN